MRRLRSLLDRFWEKVDDTAGPDRCWPWTGAVTINRRGKDGYGVIQTGGRGSPHVKAHRFALVVASGEDPADLEAGHGPTCTTTLCCNPQHLRWVTRSENELDKAWKRTDRELIAALPDTPDELSEDDPLWCSLMIAPGPRTLNLASTGSRSRASSPGSSSET